jgi:hypothetical protein
VAPNQNLTGLEVFNQVKNQMENEKIVDKAAKVALYNINDKGEPTSYEGSFGQLILTNHRLVFIKAKISFKVHDFTADINGSLKTMAGSFAVPLNEIEEACVVKKRISMQKFAFLTVKFKNGDINCFLTSGQHQEGDTVSLCNTINSMLTRAEAPTFPASSMLPSTTSRLEQPFETPQKPVEPSAGSPSKVFLFCPNCGERLPVAKKFCPFCGYSFRQVVSTSPPQMSGAAAQSPTQVSKAVATLKVNLTKPPRFISHSPAINCIVFMLHHHKIEITLQVGGVGHYKGVTIVDDNFMIKPAEIPPEIAEAAKKWDETTVINWLAPYIPRAIAKAKADPQAGIA